MADRATRIGLYRLRCKCGAGMRWMTAETENVKFPACDSCGAAQTKENVIRAEFERTPDTKIRFRCPKCGAGGRYTVVPKSCPNCASALAPAAAPSVDELAQKVAEKISRGERAPEDTDVKLDESKMAKVRKELGIPDEPEGTFTQIHSASDKQTVQEAIEKVSGQERTYPLPPEGWRGNVKK